MNATYRNIPGSPGYQVSDDGRARSCIGNRGQITKVWRDLKIYTDRHGYHYVAIYTDGKRRNRKMHQLVLETFIGPRPEGWTGRHLDGSRTNNDLSNLEWATMAVNLSDKERHGTLLVGEKNGNSKLREEDIRTIRAADVSKRGQKTALARRFGVHISVITQILLREIWKRVA